MTDFMTAFAYYATLTEEQLQQLRDELQVNLQVSWDAGQLDFSTTMRDQGCAFNDRCEVRWWRTNDASFQVLVLSDGEIHSPHLTPVAGNWSCEEQTIQLIDLKAPQFSPSFDRYPVINSSSGRLRSRVFYRNGVPVFFSMRGVIANETTPTGT
ncbi:MAG: hypothetical protein NZ959_05755 [Armatimonadetes bacterium]|nr:hypothetical protein [Armatimonadota bacterium]MDW8122431.1 hypothetical protein [Armatimonadota bacterium]